MGGWKQAAREMFSFIPESYFQTFKIPNVPAEEICRRCYLDLVISYLCFFHLRLELFFGEELCLSRRSLNSTFHGGSWAL